MLLVEDCSPHRCKLYGCSIRSKRGERKSLGISEEGFDGADG
jgi:hypothetical protein